MRRNSKLPSSFLKSDPKLILLVELLLRVVIGGLSNICLKDIGKIFLI